MFGQLAADAYLRMPIQAPQWTEFLSCPVCRHEFAADLKPPISLGCGHTICKPCLTTLHRKQCPFDQTLITIELDHLPINTALLQLVGPLAAATTPEPPPPANDDQPPNQEPEEPLPISAQKLNADDQECYKLSRGVIKSLAAYLKPFSNGNVVSFLSRPIQRKIVTLVNCQLVEDEGRLRALRTARSLGERSVTELILQHQNPQQLSANLWAAVRARGCQFLGPAMQEEVLKLVLLALEDGSALSRKVLVMFVVQRLEPHFPQASKTSIGHVVQLLYRASCFKVSKREGDSSLMQLKEEFRTYEALRREHDAQIVQIATEAGLRIAPDQWSALLYGDTGHKSHMQSIIDKLQTPQSFALSVQELVIALQRTGDPSNLSQMREHFKDLSIIDSTAENSEASWAEVAKALDAVRAVVNGLVDFVKRFGNRKLQEPNVANQNAKYKISMCRDLTLRSTCPRGPNCTFAHSEEELDIYRAKSRKSIGRTPSAAQSKDDLSIETSGSGSGNSDGSPLSTHSNNGNTKTSPISIQTKINNKSPNPPFDPKQLPKVVNTNRNSFPQFKFDPKQPPKLPLATHAQMINNVPNCQPPHLRNAPPFSVPAKPIQHFGTFPNDADSMYLPKMQTNNFEYLTSNHINNNQLGNNPMLHDEISRRTGKKLRSPQHQSHQQQPQSQPHQLPNNFFSSLNFPNGSNLRSTMQSQPLGNNKERSQVDLRRLEILKDIKKLDIPTSVANHNNNAIGPNTSGFGKKMPTSSNTGGSTNYPKNYWDNPYHMEQSLLNSQHNLPFGGSAIQSSGSPTTSRDLFVRSDSILDDDYVPFDVPTTSSKYGPISRQPILGKDIFGCHHSHDTTSMSDWLQKHNNESMMQANQRSILQPDHPSVGNFDTNKYRGVLAGYEPSTQDISFDLNVSDHSIHPYIHQDDIHFGDKSSSSSSLSPHTMARESKQLLSIDLQSFEDQLAEQNKQIPSISCPNLTQTPDSVLWNQIAQTSHHLNNNNNMPNRNTNFTINNKQPPFEHTNANSLFWSTPTTSTGDQSYHNHQHPSMMQSTTPHSSGQHSSMFSSSIAAMLPSNLAENYEFGIDSGMRELKMRFESDLEEHDKQWEQRSTSSNANNQLYASSIRQ